MQELLIGFGRIAIYFIVCASAAVILRTFVNVPSEVFRKLLHSILLGSLMVFVFGFETWWISAFASIIFAIVVYPLLWLGEHIKGYSKLLVERNTGEIKRSLLVVFGMFAVVIFICWGLLGDKMLVLASVYAWGFGDAAAALVGKRFGKHKIKGWYLNGKKSYEGTISMFLVSFVCVFIILLSQGKMSWYECAISSLVTAFVSAGVELYSRDGIDTITCPIADMITILTLAYLFGGI